MYGKTSAGVGNPPLIDSEKRLVVTSGFADYALKGNVYSGANQTGCVWTVGLATTNTGLCVSNPIGSGKILSLLAAGFSERVQPAGIQDAWIAGGYHASTDVAAGVAGTARNMKLGSAAGVGKVWTGATLPVAPVYLFPIATGKVSALLSVASSPGLIRIDGLCAIPPGGFVIIATFTVGAAVGQMGALIWEEVDE